jgi:serine/threonine-protein kinase
MGLARMLTSPDGGGSADTLTREGAVMGSFDYIAPEQALDAHAVDIRADLYSLGCTLYFLLTGQVPFPGMAPMDKLVCHRTNEPVPVEQRRPEVPPAVAAVVRRLMAKQPEDRYATPGEAAEALAGAASSAGLDAMPAPLPVAMPVESMASTVSWSSLITDPPSATSGRLSSASKNGSRLRLWLGVAAAVLAVLIALLVLVMKARGASSAETRSAAEPLREAAP